MNWRDGTASAGTADDNARTTFGYNEASELTELCTARHVVGTALGGSDCDVTDRADPAAWHYRYDAAGHRTVEIGPDNVGVTDLRPTWRWYDPSGRLVTVCSRANGASDSCTHANVTRSGGSTLSMAR